MPASCSVFKCMNKVKKGSNVSFYRFPLRNKELLHQWVTAVKREEDFTPTKNHRVCSEHFAQEDFLKGYVNIRKLKSKAVPSVFDFPKPFKKTKMGKGKLNKYRPRKRGHRSKMQRLRHQRETLTKPKGKSSHESLLIASDVSSQCVEHATTSLESSDAVVTAGKDNSTSALEVYMKSSSIPEVNIDDVLIVRSNGSILSEGENVESAVVQNSDEALETNIEDRLSICNKESGIFQCKKEPSVENELGARSTAADESFRPFTAIKQETPDPEFVLEPAESPVTEFASVPDNYQCPNPKCLETISQLKKKESGLEFQLRESLRMSGEMSLRVQSILVEKKMLESKLQMAEKEVSGFKQRYNRFFVSR